MNFFSIFKRNLIYKLKKKINIDQNNDEKLSLDQLFRKYGSDKSNELDNKDKGHGYSSFYIKHLHKLRYKKLNILEIGSLYGSSAAAFSKFFKKSTIFCIDINISKFKFKSKKIKVFGFDAANPKNVKIFLNKINNKNKKQFFDIIIDDGSHKLKDILFFLKNFFYTLKKNGYYVIEEFKFPNYFKHLNSFYEPKVDKLIRAIKKKKTIKSKILNKKIQEYMFKKINYVKIYKGNSKISDIVFLKRN